MRDFDEIILEASWKNIDREERRFRALDNKAIAITTISGILMAFLTKVGGKYSCITTLLFLLTAVSFIFTISFSILALKTRSSEWVSTENLIKDFKDREPRDQIQGIIATIAKVETSLREVCNIKAKWLKYSIYLLSVSVITMVLYSISIFF